jgi:GT2 family glycosyltransferase
LYGGEQTLRETLPTWRSSASDDVEFVFVDHSPRSLDDDFDLSAWSQYHWHPTNPGFAAGSNFGCRQASADRILLLNPDVYLDVRSLERIVATEVESTGALGLRTDATTHVGIEYTWWGFCKDRTDHHRFLVGPSGGAALINRSVLDTVGGLPEHLFAWGEDAEWALSMYRAGMRCVSVPVTLDHVGGHTVASQAGQRLKARLLARNRIATFRRTLGHGLQILLVLPFSAAILANGLRKLRQRTMRAYISGVWEGLTINIPRSSQARLTVSDWRRITARYPSPFGADPADGSGDGQRRGGHSDSPGMRLI